MKVLGLNFGRANANCGYFLDAAMKAAEAAGAEVETIQMVNKKIGRCIGCGSCSRALERGDAITCVVKDDYEAISDACLAADAIIVAAPVYVLAPTGQLKNFIDRFGPAHDMAYMMFENELRKDTGKQPLPEHYFGRKYVSYISVGGATTDHWVSMGLAGLQLFGMSMNMKAVGQVNVTGAFIPAYREKFAAECIRLGEATAKAIGKPYKEVAWVGEPGVCPACHSNLMMMGKTTTVTCPVCGIRGKVSIEGESLKLTFSEEEQSRSRMNLTGVIEHQAEIGRKDRYPNYDEYVRKLTAAAMEK